MDAREYRLQMDGLALALDDADVRAALLAGQSRLALVQWSGASRQRLSVPWAAMTGEAKIDAFAAAIRRAPRDFRHYSTAIGDALAASAVILGEVASSCEKLVIDVSGDGPSNEGMEVGATRDAVVRGGVTINALVIEENETSLADYFRENVVGGAGSFAIVAQGYDDYPEAIRRKLLRELTDQFVDAGPAAAVR